MLEWLIKFVLSVSSGMKSRDINTVGCKRGFYKEPKDLTASQMFEPH